MPGIVGVITNRPCSAAKAELVGMLRAIQHEAFYNSGTLVDESLGVYVGWTALKSSFSDCMPLRNEREDVSLVFSGDEYPDPQIVQQLRSRGHSIGPTESAYLVHLYEDDPDFVQRLNGMFHGLIIDRARGRSQRLSDGGARRLRLRLHEIQWRNAAVVGPMLVLDRRHCFDPAVRSLRQCGDRAQHVAGAGRARQPVPLDRKRKGRRRQSAARPGRGPGPLFLINRSHRRA